MTPEAHSTMLATRLRPWRTMTPPMQAAARAAMRAYPVPLPVVIDHVEPGGGEVSQLSPMAPAATPPTMAATMHVQCCLVIPLPWGDEGSFRTLREKF